MLSWQEWKTAFCGQVRTLVGYHIAYDVTTHDITSPMTWYVKSPWQWRHGNGMTCQLWCLDTWVQVHSSGQLDDGWKCYTSVSLCRWESGRNLHRQWASDDELMNITFCILGSRMLTRTALSLSSLRNAVCRQFRRNIGVTAPAAAQLDPIQQIFVDKIREYAKKSKWVPQLITW